MNFIKSTTFFFYTVYNKKRALLFFIFLISIFVSLLFLFFFKDIGPSQHAVPGTDYLYFYEPVAESILQGKGIPVKENFAIRYPPGYPVFLSMIFYLSQLIGINKLELVVIFNIVITAFACCFLFLIAELIFRKRIALIASFLWLSYPFNLWFLKNPNTEVPFIFLLFLGIWFYILALKKKHSGFIFITGVILGLASLVRPIGLLLPLLLALMIFFLLKETSRKIQFFLAIILLIGNLIIIFPWEYYVFSETGRLIPLSTGGPPSIAGGIIWLSKEGQGGNRITLSSDVLALTVRAENSTLNTTGDVLYFFLQELVDQPIAFFKLIGLKIVRAWYSTSQMWWEGQILAVQILYLLTGFIGIALGIKTLTEDIKYIFFLLSVIFYFWGMTILGLSMLRYMVPAMGFFMIFSAITVNILLDKWNKKIRKFRQNKLKNY